MFSNLPYSTGRLTLRKLSVDDVAAFHEYRSDANVARFQGWAPMSLKQAADFLMEQEVINQLRPGHWHQIGIALPGSNCLIGDMGIWLSADQSKVEFGLSISAGFQGQGFGSEAISALVRLIFSYTEVEEIVANTDIRNLPCLAALIRAGMNYQTTSSSVYKDEECTEKLFSINRLLMQKP
jgi:RimJ/RimL family protein N-acetyltransferase